LGPGGRPRRVLGPPLWRHICADNTGSCTRIDHRPRGDGGCHSANWYDAPISKFSLRNSSRVRLNRGRYRPRRQGHRARTGNVAVTPWEENVTRRRSTGDLGRTRGVEGDGEATRPRRFPPRGAPWTGLPRAGRPPLTSSLTPRRPTGRPTAGPRRWCDPGRRPPRRSSVGGRYSARLSRCPAVCPSEYFNQVLGARVSNACSTAGDPSWPPVEGRALSRPYGTPGYPTEVPRPCRAYQCRLPPTGS